MSNGGKGSVEPIYASLKASILSGELAGGTPLRQDEIALRHGVSKIPVREALQRLAVEGLVRFRPHRGAIVREISLTDILQLLDVRVALECRALELAIPEMIESDFTALNSVLAKYARQTRVSAWSELNRDFHRLLCEPCANAHLLSLIADVQQKIGPRLRLLLSHTSGLERPMREHEDIVRACMDGRVADAVATLRQHIETTRREVATHLRSNADDDTELN